MSFSTIDHKPRGLPFFYGPEHNGLCQYLLRFLDWSAAKGYTYSTIKTREVALRGLLLWCDARGYDTPQALTPTILESYRRHLYHCRQDNGKPLSLATQDSLLQPVRAFGKWMAKQRLLPYNPASEQELPRLPKSLPKAWLTPSEVEQVANQAMLSGPCALRDRAIVEILYATGVRRMELVKLSVTDVDLDRLTVRILQGKGGRDRLAPLGERAAAWVRQYCDELRPRLAINSDQQVLFLTHDGHPMIKNRLGDLIRKLLDRASIDKPGGCHLFRHAMATAMPDNGADVCHIQAILGHSQLSTTEIYTHLSIRQLQQVHAQTHPASQLRPHPLPVVRIHRRQRATPRILIILVASVRSDQKNKSADLGRGFCCSVCGQRGHCQCRFYGAKSS